jgi:lipopolysaccharide transport system permease protein
MASAVCLPRVVEAETRRIELRGVIYKVTKECAVVANRPCHSYAESELYMWRDSWRGPDMEDSRPTKIVRPPKFSLAGLVADLNILRNFGGLLYTLTMLRLNVRYKQSILGWLWAVLQPLSLMLIYTVVFSTVATVHTGRFAYPVFVFSGLLPWIFFASAVSNATSGLVNHSYLLTRVYFPREIIPFSYAAAALVDFLIASLILGALMLYYRISLTFTALIAVPVVVVLSLFGTGVALLLSALQARFRDVGVAMPLLLQVWMFATPVVYPLEAVPRRFRTICLANPVAGLIDSFRRVVLQGVFPDLPMLCYSTLFAVAFFAVAYSIFKILDANMADII